MKNIFKKNHIIITALAIMIIIAGYLSFTNRDAKENADDSEVANLDTEDYDEYTQLDGFEVVTDTTGTGTDTTTDTDTEADTDTDTTTDTTDTDTDTTTDMEADALEEEADSADTGDLGMEDISDEDMLADAKDVTDNGELDLEEGVPGEAVLTNAAIDASYFISSRIDREQVRARNKETLRVIIDSQSISDEAKAKAINSMIELTEIAEKENAAEKLLEAKGFDGAVVYIVDDQVDVIINADTLSDQQLAIIEDVVKGKTGFEVGNIHITTVVVSE